VNLLERVGRNLLGHRGNRRDAVAGVEHAIVGQYRLPVPKAGKNSAGFRVVSHAKTPDDSFNVYADIVVVQQGRAISVATMTGFIEPLATASEARLVRTIASRLGARVGAA